MTKDVTSDYFSKNVYDFKNIDSADELKFLGKNPVVVDFHTKWCGPCKMLSPIIDELDTEYKNVDFYKVDIEDEIELAQSFGVMSVPTLLFIPKDDKPFISPGAPSKDMLKEMIEEKLLGKEVKKDPIKEFNSIIDKIKGML